MDNNFGLSQEEIYMMILAENARNRETENNSSNITEKDKNSNINEKVAQPPIIETIKTEEMIEKKKPKTKRKKCQYKDCKRKLKFLDDDPCKCGMLTCAKHRFFSDHDCTFDYRAENQKNLTKNNPQIIREKFEKI